jgi:hypothetical protein
MPDGFTVRDRQCRANYTTFEKVRVVHRVRSWPGVAWTCKYTEPLKLKIYICAMFNQVN